MGGNTGKAVCPHVDFTYSHKRFCVELGKENSFSMSKALITGGAGFIGSHLAEAILLGGHDVKVFDSLESQVHGKVGSIPEYIRNEIEFIKGDIRDRELLRKALSDVGVVFHEASAVGVGQSMYQIHKYVDVNSLGTASLLDILANEKHNVRKLLVASSMSIYGEGKYLCDFCGEVFPKLRSSEQLSKHCWEMTCPGCSQPVKPTATDEDKPLYPTSVYAISKRDQEEMCLCVGRAYDVPTVALRYFNVYGPGQALSNPYTGVAAIFSSRILNGKAPLVFEDGLQSRDFIHIDDIVQANLLAMKSDDADFEVFNVGTGRSITILEVARTLSEKLGFDQPPEINNLFREGDIRHCYADITKIQNALGFVPKICFEDGMEGLVEWVMEQRAVDSTELARAELQTHRLIR